MHHFHSNFACPNPMESRDMEDLQSQLPTRWLELDNPGKLQALDNSGLKTYILKAESIRPFLGRVGHLVGEFWENFKSGHSTVLGHRILVMQQDIFRATGLPNKGCTVGYWFENRDSIVKRIGKEAWNAEHAMRLKQLCGVLTNFKHDFPVDMIKDGTTRYVASLVMEHLSGWCTVSDCSYGFLDAIEQGMKREITNWCAHIAKRMKVVRRKAVTARTEGTQKEFRYAVVIALLVREQAPDLWQHVAENEGRDLELLKKRGRNKINGVQDIGWLEKKRRMNEINGVQGREMLKERRMKEINGNGFELKNMKAERKAEGSEGDRYGEKRPMLSVDLEQEAGIEDTEGLQMQGKVESKQDSLGYQGAGAVLQRIKVGLAEECAETAEHYLADREAWMEASVQEVPDAELLEQYYSDLTFGSGDRVWENWMHFNSMSQWRRFSGFAELEQRERKKGRRTREYDKMLVVSVEYILAHFVHKSKVPFAHGDLYVDPYIVFVHPQACRFLWACLSVFKVVLWSEKPKEVHDLVLQHILGCTTSFGRILSYSVEDCIIMRITLKGNAVHGCCKDLTRVWDDLGDYDNVNTLLIDTSPVTMLRNQDGNVICPIPYQYHVQASHWQLEAYLLPYLECLESVQCIPEFVKNFPFCLEKGHAWERSQFEEGRVTPLFGTPCPPCRHGIVKYWQLFPSIVTETSNSQLDLFNTQCPGINNTGKQLPITRTSISFSQSVPPTANLGIFEMYHGISSGKFLGFSDYIRSNNNMKYTMELNQLIKQSDGKMKFKRELIRRAEDDIKYTRELNQAKADLHNMAYEKNKLEKKLQEVEDAWEKSHEEKIKAEKKNTNLSKAFVERGRILKKMDLDKNRELKKSENTICSLQNTVQALEKELGSFAQKQEEFQILVQREVEKETAQIRSILTDILGLKQEEDPVIEAQQLITESRQRCKVKQSNNKGTSSHMSTDKSTSDGSHLLLTSDTEALHCSICMEELTTAGDHRICSLACGHMFGMSCIRRWLQLHEKNIGTCPQCNKKSKLDDIRILYAPAIPVTERQH